LIAALSRAARSIGTVRGLKNPAHSVKSKFGSPVAAATVGMSGAFGDRLADVTASSFRS
jgi:hypothetical protein